jgi:uncharacterized protein
VIRRRFRIVLDHGPVLGVVRIPEGPPPRSAVVLVHGFLGSADRDFMPWLADGLARDHAVVSYTSPGSGVGPSGTHTELDRLASSTHTRELEELSRVVAWTAGGEGLVRAPRTLALVGHGRGGAHALLFAAGDLPSGMTVQALVTWAAPSRLDRWTDATRETWRREGRIHVPGPGTGRQLPLDVTLLEDAERHGAEFDLLAAARRLETPWLLVHGTDDVVVDESEGRALAAAARHARSCLVAGGDHYLGGRDPFSGPGTALDEALSATRAHLRRHLNSERTRAGR